MATPEIQMTSHGMEHEKCAGCEQIIPRGQRMSGVRFNDGTPAGWYCDDCVDRWKQTGDPRPVGA